MFRIISKAIVSITLLVLNLPKYHRAVNAGIKDRHGGVHPQRTKQTHHSACSWTIKAIADLRILPQD